MMSLTPRRPLALPHAFVLALFALLSPLAPGARAATVAVHDPSIIVVYKDAAGASYPANDAGGTRTKLYYVFGTQVGAAYSTDMIDWTPFTPTFSVNGTITSNYLQAFQAAAAWSGHATSNDVRGNLWAPDIIWNKALKKWCLYFSVNGDDWKSSIVMHTADRIEGPYAYAGSVVYSGMDQHSSGAGNADYQLVTGSATVAARYLDAQGAWKGTYGSSCIDPSVFYDEQGRLWMVYGSWSGGIFLIKLSENTGLRDRAWNYVYADDAVWNGTTLRYDPYMGLHLAGGYYVSGEGSYIRYLADPDGKNGYYYLFVSMGFYSPEGGYTMRVFRSPTVDGTYTDVTGDNAAVGAYVFNYGSNVKYGFPLLQNHKWSWWSRGEIAQGHNSVLRDEDGRAYLVYHRKFDDGTIFHNVEVHELLFNDQGWIVAAPFEHRVGFGLRKVPYSIEEIAGAYGIIVHDAVDYANLKSNTEKELRLNADGTLSGAFTGTWTYGFSEGRQYLNLATSAGAFRGVLAEQPMNDLSTRTVTFTAMNPANERALWGYRRTSTARTRTTAVHDHGLKIGAPDTTLAWDAYDRFRKDSVSGDFEVEYTFVNGTRGAEAWHNWALVMQNGGAMWYLRADAHSNTAFAGSTVKYKTDWSGAVEFKSAFRNRRVRVKAVKTGTTIDVFAYADSTLVLTATATNCPAGPYTVLLGGEAVLLDVERISARTLGARQRIGTVNDDGTYTVAFNTAKSETTSVAGDFELVYRFVNYHNPESPDTWDNYIVRLLAGTRTMLLRADLHALDAIGTVTSTSDWKWTDFNRIVSGAQVEIAIRRQGSIIAYHTTIAARDGTTWHATTTQTGAPTTPLSFGLTNEESMIDLLEVERVSRLGQDPGPVGLAPPATRQPSAPRIYARGRRIVIESDRAGTARLMRPDGRVALGLRYAPGLTRTEAVEPGIYLVEGQRLLVQ